MLPSKKEESKDELKACTEGASTDIQAVLLTLQPLRVLVQKNTFTLKGGTPGPNSGYIINLISDSEIKLYHN